MEIDEDRVRYGEGGGYREEEELGKEATCNNWTRLYIFIATLTLFSRIV